MSVDRGASNGKTMQYDNVNNYSSCVSASTPNKGVASNNSRMCVVGVSANNKTPALPVSLIGSDENNEHKYLQVNDSIAVGKIGNKNSERTEFGSSTEENRPIFSIIFRNRDIARLVSIGSELKYHVRLFTNYHCAVEDSLQIITMQLKDCLFQIWRMDCYVFVGK
jgi:hypothetical protein